jgi:hypothetical protein
MPKFPDTAGSPHTPDGAPVPNPRKHFSSEHSVSSSTSAGVGHNDSMNRMPHPFRDGFAPNDESGEGKG